MENALDYLRFTNLILPVLIILTQVWIIDSVARDFHRTNDKWLATALLIQTIAVLVSSVRTIIGYWNVILQQPQMTAYQANISILVVNVILLVSQVIIILVSKKK